MAVLVVCALLCLSGWVSLYFLLCNINGSRSCEWNCRLVTLLHGILAVCITAYIGYVDGPWPFTDPGTKNTPLQITAMMVSLGYFIFDMGCIVRFARRKSKSWHKQQRDQQGAVVANGHEKKYN
ncbi:TLC domain-containing protein 5a isoform X2 [Scomber japonicus]|uniref:TLC domain-containing protein 5a isoform X2 n=1 Tax=Scomber japonicus TaxID=13676 RepID=UPI0023061D1A|nr:TLC domain-containing protein 5a isoform X2 [Scomber japonicus]